MKILQRLLITCLLLTSLALNTLAQCPTITVSDKTINSVSSLLTRQRELCDGECKDVSVDDYFDAFIGSPSIGSNFVIYRKYGWYNYREEKEDEYEVSQLYWCNCSPNSYIKKTYDSKPTTEPSGHGYTFKATDCTVKGIGYLSSHFSWTEIAPQFISCTFTSGSAYNHNHTSPSPILRSCDGEISLNTLSSLDLINSGNPKLNSVTWVKPKTTIAPMDILKYSNFKIDLDVYGDTANHNDFSLAGHPGSGVKWTTSAQTIPNGIFTTANLDLLLRHLDGVTTLTGRSGSWTIQEPAEVSTLTLTSNNGLKLNWGTTGLLSAANNTFTGGTVLTAEKSGTLTSNEFGANSSINLKAGKSTLSGNTFQDNSTVSLGDSATLRSNTLNLTTLNISGDLSSSSTKYAGGPVTLTGSYSGTSDSWGSGAATTSLKAPGGVTAKSITINYPTTMTSPEMSFTSTNGGGKLTATATKSITASGNKFITEHR